MNQNLLLLVIAILFSQVSTIHLQTHERYTDGCFYLPMGEIKTNPSFTYTVTKAWTKDEVSRIKSGALNIADYLTINGWTAYDKPNAFLQATAKLGPSILLQKNNYVKFLQHILTGDQARQYKLSTADLQFAFGNPSKASTYMVKPNSALIALRFQVFRKTTDPFVGVWSVLLNIVEQKDIESQMKSTLQMVRDAMVKYSLTPLDIARSLNIIPDFVRSSVFSAIADTTPAKGTVAPVSYQAFLVVIRAGQEFMAGPINDGQPGVIQLKDLVTARTSCA